MDGWWLKKILGWRSTWGRVGGRSNFFRSLRPSLSKGSWTCWTWSICPGKSVEHVTSTEGKHTLSKYWGSNSTSPWLSWKWIQLVFYQPENLFYRIACSESDSMRVSVDVWLEFFNSLVCGIGTKHLGKEIISERENLAYRLYVINTESLFSNCWIDCYLWRKRY